jgi:hypothetical protein
MAYLQRVYGSMAAKIKVAIPSKGIGISGQSFVMAEALELASISCSRSLHNY